jgi:hypothetical protein
MSLGAPAAEDVSDEEGEGVDAVSRTVPLGKRVCILGLVLISCLHCAAVLYCRRDQVFSYAGS